MQNRKTTNKKQKLKITKQQMKNKKIVKIENINTKQEDNKSNNNR